jgi:two-component system, OmpR family, sensor histidine kinase BaeS
MGLGLFAFLALMLAAQGALLLWLTDRTAGSMPATSPQRLADLVASDIGTALGEDPALDLEAYVRQHYDNVFQSFVVVMRDGRTVANHDDLPVNVQELLRAEAQRRPPPDRRFPARGFGAGRGGRQGAGPSGARVPPTPRPLRERPDPGTFRGGIDQGRAAGTRASLSAIGDFSPIAVDNVLVGRVAVLTGRPPFSRIARALGPTMGIVGGGVLAVGGALIAFVVFGPVRRRLREVQNATERLGRGDQSARAPAYGGDEVAAVAGSFNRMADELGARAEALSASDRARRQLLADISHELNTPLTAMRGYLETIAMPNAALDTATRDRYFSIVMEETHRLERIIGDLLDLARLEAAGTAMQRAAVSVPALFERVAMRHEHDLHTHGVTLVRTVGPDANSINGDADRLEQALQNLAANALRHTPSGGTITLSAERAGAHLRIRVEDTGPGIAPEHLPVIFDRFYKSDDSRTSGGSGLGLSIVKAIVERHGGTVTAGNGQGALFEILLPATAPA